MARSPGSRRDQPSDISRESERRGTPPPLAKIDGCEPRRGPLSESAELRSLRPVGAATDSAAVTQTAALQAGIAELTGRLAEQEHVAAAREHAAAATRALLEGRLAEIERQHAAVLARQRGEAERAIGALKARLESDLAAAAERSAEQRRLAEGREAALRESADNYAQRLTTQIRAAAEQQSAGERAVGDVLWRLARRGFLANEQLAALRATVADLVALLKGRPVGLTETALWRSWRPWTLGAADLWTGGTRPRGGRAAVGARRRDTEAGCRRAVAHAPGSADDWTRLGRMLLQRGDHAGAVTALRRAIAVNEAAVEPHLLLGRALAAAGELSAASDSYAALLRLQPASLEAQREVDELDRRIAEEADLARDRRDWVAAARLYWRVLEKLPELMPIWVQLGHVLKEQGDFAGAEAAYRRALLLDGGVADTHLQLGHLLKLQGRRSLAARAYAAAVRLEPELLPARESLHAVLGYSPTDVERFLAGPNLAMEHAEGGRHLGRPFLGGLGAAKPLWRFDPGRYGTFFTEALCHIAERYDILWLPVIDWNYRIQRPQHLARQLALGGSRVFYISITFDDEQSAGEFRIVESPHPGVFEVRLRVRSGPGSNIYAGLSAPVIDDVHLALDTLVAAMAIRSPVVIVDHPSWHPVAFGIAGGTVVYDCLDLATGFSDAAESVPAAERALIDGADAVVVASAPLARHLAPTREAALVRNAADVDFFAAAYSERPAGDRPVVGYFGAIADWFDIACIEHCAAARPDWEFRLIGRTDGCDISRAERLANVRFLGERPYGELPGHLRGFDVAVIPFAMTELIRCTNPVKLYEYMAAGKPVVSAPLPEVIEATDLAYIAGDPAIFEQRIAQALAEDCDELRQRRRAWAQQHTWAARATGLAETIDACLPLVSVVVLTFNNWELSEQCLLSLRRLSDYPKLEIIVVDNASTDQTRQRLREIAEQDRRLKLLLNDRNLGFAGGNNVGLAAATGEYVILLNNDTVVTRGWVRDLIRPMQRDPQVGLVGPLTNRIGNEQRVVIAYDDLDNMALAARRQVRRRLRRRLPSQVVAFFCVAMRRAMVADLGLLDEAYGLGFFEDDDYCMKAAKAGWKVVIADDVFVHHHHSAAFGALGEAAAAQMARNRRLFESRWGPWQPHSYRDEPGFRDEKSTSDAREK